MQTYKEERKRGLSVYQSMGKNKQAAAIYFEIKNLKEKINILRNLKPE